LRGGGVKGMYEVGVLESFLANLPPEEIAYDVSVGVSIGAVNSATIGLFEKGQEKEAFALLKDYWSNLDTNEIFVEWPKWGPIAGFWKNSFFDNTPSHKYINDRFINPVKRKVSY
jgi:predicted acylesterase/phospholipase RssA